VFPSVARAGQPLGWQIYLPGNPWMADLAAPPYLGWVGGVRLGGGGDRLVPDVEVDLTDWRLLCVSVEDTTVRVCRQLPILE